MAKRALVVSDGRVSTKVDKDEYHIRDIEEYHKNYLATSPTTYPDADSASDVEDVSVSGDGGAPATGGLRHKTRKKRRKGRASVAEVVFGAAPPIRTHSSGIHDVHTADYCYVSKDSVVDITAMGEHAEDLVKLLEAADLGDPIALHCLLTGHTVSPEEKEPNTIKQAYSLPDRQQWREAVEIEWNMVNKFNVLSDPIPAPAGSKPLNCRWVFKRKRDHLGNVIKYKARLTPQGCFQHFGIDYGDTYAPVARMTTLRYVLALASLLHLQTTSVDFTNAFLNAPLDEDVYINAPPGTPELPRGYVYKVQRALYGLKQSPRAWNITLNDFMVKQCDFRQLKVEKCMYIKRNRDGTCVLVCLYVDDLVIAYNSRSSLESFLAKVKTQFKITQSESLQKTLGFQIERTANGDVFMHQKAYIEEVLKRFGMLEARIVDTPADYRIKLTKEGAQKARSSVSSAATQGESTSETVHEANAVARKKKKLSSIPGKEGRIPYRELIGCLLWISMGTRPDISYAVNQCARYAADPKEDHWTACLRILRYLKGTPDYGLHYQKQSTQFLSTGLHQNDSGLQDGTGSQKEPQNTKRRFAQMEDLKQPVSYAAAFYPGDVNVHLQGYSDADYASNLDDRRSITGYVFMFAGAPLSWNSMTQHSVSLSTMESEYYAVCKATQEAIYLRMLFEESGIKVDAPLTIFEDNQACIAFTKQPGEHTRTKHIDVRACFVRQWVEHGELVLEPIATKEQLADILTKALEPAQFAYLRSRLVRPRSSVM